MEQAKSALVWDPLSGYAHANYALTCSFAGRNAEALEVSRHAIELDSDSFLTHWTFQMVLLLSGQFDASVAAAESTLAMSGRHPWSMALLAVALVDSGRAAAADAVYCEMQARARHQYVAPSMLALAAAAAARQDEAIGHAHEACEIRDPHCQNFFSRYFSGAARLYRYPRFREVIARMGRSDWLREPGPPGS
jgi:tetratricopeptide (TPR) repeat protein